MVWSAACSRGHEVYSRDMFFNEMKTVKNVKWKILGTDINSQALNKVSLVNTRLQRFTDYRNH